MRARFTNWLEDDRPDTRPHYLTKLEKHDRQKIDLKAWQVNDRAFPRVGSSTTYGIFRHCLQYVTLGDYEADLQDDEDVEFESLKEFRARLKPRSLKIPFAAHFLESGDT